MEAVGFKFEILTENRNEQKVTSYSWDLNFYTAFSKDKSAHDPNTTISAISQYIVSAQEFLKKHGETNAVARELGTKISIAQNAIKGISALHRTKVPVSTIVSDLSISAKFADLKVLNEILSENSGNLSLVEGKVAAHSQLTQELFSAKPHCSFKGSKTDKIDSAKLYPGTILESNSNSIKIKFTVDEAENSFVEMSCENNAAALTIEGVVSALGTQVVQLGLQLKQ